MTKLVLLSIALLAACQPDQKNLERKVDQIAQDQKKILDMLASGRGAAGAAAGQRAPRPEPDRSKTYAVPIDNDVFDGPPDAKVTVVKAIDYA
jgi:protein-disulfide isomerase